MELSDYAKLLIYFAEDIEDFQALLFCETRKTVNVGEDNKQYLNFLRASDNKLLASMRVDEFISSKKSSNSDSELGVDLEYASVTIFTNGVVEGQGLLSVWNTVEMLVLKDLSRRVKSLNNIIRLDSDQNVFVYEEKGKVGYTYYTFHSIQNGVVYGNYIANGEIKELTWRLA